MDGLGCQRALGGDSYVTSCRGDLASFNLSVPQFSHQDYLRIILQGPQLLWGLQKTEDTEQRPQPAVGLVWLSVRVHGVRFWHLKIKVSLSASLYRYNEATLSGLSLTAVVKAERCCPLSRGPILPVPQRHPRPASLWCVLQLTLEVSSPRVCHAVSGPCYLEAECWETSPLSGRVRVTPPCLGTKERDGGSSLRGIQRAGP